jgi:Nucleotidyltransferase domain
MARLVAQGLVQATEMGRNRVHQLNREHVAAPIATTMADLRIELWRRMRKELGGWKPKPLYACVFGSAARGDGDADSDVDLLLVHPPFPGDAEPPRKANVIDAVAAFMTAPMPASHAEAARWPRHVDQLRAHVLLWSGNPLQVVDLSLAEWADKTRNGALIAEIERDAIDLVGTSIVADPARTNRAE